MNTKNTNLDDEVMCSCSGTTRGEIQSLFKEGLDMDAISRRTGALSGCAGCEWDVAQFLKALADAK
ncbi:MAG: (2Fe-2S)-binding protein [Methylotenera sp.]